MATTVIQHQSHSYPIGQHQPAVIQLQTVHNHTTTTTTTNRSPVNQEYSQKAAVITGTLQICCGAVLVVLGIAALCIGSVYKSAWNIWGGICFYIVTGIIGVVSKNQNRCMIVSYMTMSIISAICAGGQLIYDSVAASVQSQICDMYMYPRYDCHSTTGIVTVHALAACAGFIEMIVAITASAYCCCGSCGPTPAQNTVIHWAQPYPGGHVTIVTPGNYPQGPAIINPSQTYGMGPYPPQYTGPPTGHIGEPIGPATLPPVTQFVGHASPPNMEQHYQHPQYSPPAYSYTQPASTVPVPLDPEPRPDTAFK